jgi:hypothetical protein
MESSQAVGTQRIKEDKLCVFCKPGEIISVYSESKGNNTPRTIEHLECTLTYFLFPHKIAHTRVLPEGCPKVQR